MVSKLPWWQEQQQQQPHPFAQYAHGGPPIGGNIPQHQHQHLPQRASSNPPPPHTTSRLLPTTYSSNPYAAPQVRFHIIRNARIEYVGISQSCMVSNPYAPPQRRAPVERTASKHRMFFSDSHSGGMSPREKAVVKQRCVRATICR